MTTDRTDAPAAFDWTSLLMGVAFAAMWSSAFTSARIIVADAPPLTTLALRFLLSGLIAVGIARAQGQTWRLTREQWRATAVFGICQNALYLGLYFMAMRTVEASLAAIVASSLPLWVAAAGRAFLGERVAPVGVVGLAAGLAGVLLVMGGRLAAGSDPGGVALCAAGVFALAMATLSVRGAASGGNVLMIVGLQMLIGAAALGVAGLFEDHAVEMSWTLVAAFLYTTLVPGLAATFVWFLLVGRIGAVRAASFHFLNPFLGVAIAALVLGEAIGPLDLLGVVVITAGILLVQRARVRRA